MAAQSRSRSDGANLALEASSYCLRLARVRDDGHYLFRLQDLAYRHRNRLLWRFGHIGEPSLSDLLESTGFVQIDDQVRFFGFEISGRIIERKMAVLTNAHESDIDGSSRNGFACAPD